MTTINFPNSPQTGDTYSFGTKIWEWDGSAWVKFGTIPSIVEESYEWTRPSDWLAMPSMSEGEQKIAGLFAIYPGGSGAVGPTGSGEFFAFEIGGCTYTVDWGNGVTNAYSSGTRAQYVYYFSDISSSTQTTEGFRQILMQAYPTIAGTTFSRLDFSRQYTQPGVTLSSNAQNLISLKIISNSLIGLTLTNPNALTVREFEYVGQSNITDFSNLFNNAKMLKKIIGTQWTSKGITFNQMFSGASSIETIPLLDVSQGVNFNAMFSQCYGLKSIPLLNTSNGKIFTSFLSDCASLKSVPLFNLSSGITLTSFFNSCRSLRTVPQYDFSSAKNAAGFFQNCDGLTEVPLLDTSSCVSLSAMFNGCRSLQTIPQLNTSSNTTFNSFFSNCSCLIYVPDLNTSKSTTFIFMFNNCYGLSKIPKIDGISSASYGLMFQSTGNIKSCPIENVFQSIDFSGNQLSSAAINDIFNGLGVTSGKTITITNNWGASGCNRSIATGKGWAVSG